MSRHMSENDYEDDPEGRDPRDEVDDEEEDEDYEEEPDFSDDPDFVDEIDDAALMGDILARRPKESDGVDSVVVVDGTPVVGPDRLDKLKKIVSKVFGQVGDIVNEHHPVEANGTSKGYVFLEYANHATALEAVRSLNNYRLDKQHKFTVNLFSDFDKYMSIPDEWEPPKEEAYKDQGNLKSWLLNTDAYDQFSIIYEGGEKVAIHQNAKPDPVQLELRPRWTETYLKWSPSGTFLVTLHSPGIAIWGGQDFRKLQRLSHPGVQYVDFSPCERYVVTFAPQAPISDEPTAVIFWEARSGLKKRAFNADGPPVWPLFKWSHDDKYFARMTDESTLSIYETPSFGMLDKKSIKVAGMQDFSWAPTENILVLMTNRVFILIAYWVAEDKDVPARVTLIEIPSRNEVRVKNLFNVADCKMHWQKSGDYLCVKVDRYSKLRRERDDGPKYAGLYYNFEIFHMREKQIPVDSVEIKENVQAFAWEPIGHKFAIIHGEGQSLNVSFYGVKTGHTPALLKKYERKTANCLFWSPCGQFIILAGLRNMSGVLEFVDTSDFTTMNTGEHFMCTDVEWDPTGRYVMTGVSWWGHKVDNAYWLWSFQGKILKRCQLDKFCQFLWRPRPPTLLTKKDVKEIKKNFKKYTVDFEAQDMMRSSKASKELIDKRRAKYDEYKAYRAKKLEQFQAYRDMRIQLRNGMDTDTLEVKNAVMEEEVVEFLVKEEVTIVD
eukprot:TCALIF_03606-PA protein Name:"Similar to Eif3b Eukaryotic translation initiation factor 3 subunit B (Mus musculus)" AED:0.03 eAED:0.03 QI:134/0.75/0.8/1/1/1/5/29/718